jgi:hypothetical protein
LRVYPRDQTGLPDYLILVIGGTEAWRGGGKSMIYGPFGPGLIFLRYTYTHPREQLGTQKDEKTSLLAKRMRGMGFEPMHLSI